MKLPVTGGGQRAAERVREADLEGHLDEHARGPLAVARGRRDVKQHAIAGAGTSVNPSGVPAAVTCTNGASDATRSAASMRVEKLTGARNPVGTVWPAGGKLTIDSDWVATEISRRSLQLFAVRAGQPGGIQREIHRRSRREPDLLRAHEHVRRVDAEQADAVVEHRRRERRIAHHRRLVRPADGDGRVRFGDGHAAVAVLDAVAVEAAVEDEMISVAAAGTTEATAASASRDQINVRVPPDCQNTCSSTGAPCRASGPLSQPAAAATAVTANELRRNARIGDVLSMHGTLGGSRTPVGSGEQSSPRPTRHHAQGYAPAPMSLPPIEIAIPAIDGSPTIAS